MNAPRGVSALRTLRHQPTWRLLAADKAPAVIAMLQELLLVAEKTLPASVLVERVGRMLEAVRAHDDMPQPAQAYIADWLSQGWLTRRLAAGASEEEYELSSEAQLAIRFVTGLGERRALATESRLAVVLQQLARLADETDTNPDSRLAALTAERARIDREIELLRRRGVQPISNERAVERAREIIALTDELAADFRRVRDDFDQLNRRLREDLVDHQGNRGDVLQSLFAGVDLIGESSAGKTFSGFWRLLTDPQQSEILRDALNAIANRPFLAQLTRRERKFLLNITGLLADEGGKVHEVLQNLARSLRSFVQSREYLEQRRLHALLQRATQAAFAARRAVRPAEELDYELTLTSSRVRSPAQLALYDPAERIGDTDMRASEPTELGLAEVSELLKHSEIDFRALRRNVRALLADKPRATIAELLARFPAEQGLGSVVGYVAIGAKDGVVTEQVESVHWSGRDGVTRYARIPFIYFERGRFHELLD